MTESKLWQPLAESYETSRNHLHQIAFFAVSPARHKEVGRMGLRPTPGGFGTPEFNGQVARVEGTLLVHEKDGNTATQEISTVRAAAEFLTGEYQEKWFDDFHDPLAPLDPDAELAVEEQDTYLIGNWFEFAFGVLNRLRAEGTDDDDVSEAQIWPEHFDGATELGAQDAGRRASYGASPGDGGISEPYIYVAPWSEVDKSDAYWSSDHFGGSTLTYSELSDASSPSDTALDFYLTGYRKLRS